MATAEKPLKEPDYVLELQKLPPPPDEDFAGEQQFPSHGGEGKVDVKEEVIPPQPTFTSSPKLEPEAPKPLESLPEKRDAFPHPQAPPMTETTKPNPALQSKIQNIMSQFAPTSHVTPPPPTAAPTMHQHQPPMMKHEYEMPSPAFQYSAQPLHQQPPLHSFAQPTERVSYPTERISYPTERVSYPTERISYPTERVSYPSVATMPATQQASYPSLATATAHQPPVTQTQPHYPSLATTQTPQSISYPQIPKTQSQEIMEQVKSQPLENNFSFFLFLFPFSLFFLSLFFSFSING